MNGQAEGPSEAADSDDEDEPPAADEMAVKQTVQPGECLSYATAPPLLQSNFLCSKRRHKWQRNLHPGIPQDELCNANAQMVLCELFPGSIRLDQSAIHLPMLPLYLFGGVSCLTS